MSQLPETESSFTARDYRSGLWIRIGLADGMIVEVSEETGPEEIDDLDPWVAPALWDLQTNGRWGVSFSDGSLTVEQVSRIVKAHDALGVAKLCPTLITASAEALRHGVSTIAAACDLDKQINSRVLGIHLEGPWISPEDGYRGAHPREHVRDPDWAEFEALQRASGSRIVLVTLAPERPGAIEFIRRLTDSGVAVAIGHSAADAETLDRACEAGLVMSTHLGNGLPALLPRHPNPIWWQVARTDLAASFIADGRHLDPITLGVLIRAKTPERTILVSDASPLAAAPVGRYGPWEVSEDGSIVVAGTPYLAGSNLDLWRAVPLSMNAAHLTLEQAMDAASRRPAQLLGRPSPEIQSGGLANLILFRIDPDSNDFQLTASLIDGRWCLPIVSHSA